MPVTNQQLQTPLLDYSALPITVNHPKSRSHSPVSQISLSGLLVPVSKLQDVIQ